MIGVIAGKELRLLFYSPMSWLFLALFQFIAAWLFFIQIDQFVDLQNHMIENNVLYNVTDRLVMPFFDSLGILVTLFLPFLSMSIVSREYQHQTLALLQSAPISAWDIVLGKYIALLFYALMIVFLALIMSAVLSLGTVLDWYKVAACLLALSLLMCLITAMGVFFSTLFEQSVVAGLVTLSCVFLSMLFGWEQSSDQGIFAYLSLQQHYKAMISGWVSTADVVFFLLSTTLLLSWSAYKLSSAQWAES